MFSFKYRPANAAVAFIRETGLIQVMCVLSTDSLRSSRELLHVLAYLGN